jgi:hypothetical protein
LVGFGWGSPAADKVVGICVQQKLPPGKTDNGLSEGGTQRTRLIGFACNLNAIEATKEVGCQWRLGRSRRVRVCSVPGEDMSYAPFIKLLVVTLRVAWFNFRGWNKRR